MSSVSAPDEVIPGRILVVEDDRAIALTVSALLEDDGYEVETAGDGAQALSRLRDGPRPDLIILDLVLPVIDG